MKRTFWILSLAALAIMLIMVAGRSSARGTTPAEDKPSAEIKIDNFVFSPNTVTVPAGTTIQWTNHDDIPHNVVADDKSFKSKVLDTDEAFSYTFSKPGTYSYFCSIHPKMTGKVVVQ
ncbi:MAG TPA: cupredoxin family copper-binding protein [Candidatus Angelobacter sp.]|nr:cupredoxin family copper-binding protein [Candidatus Angelobacter sp.]